MIFEIVRALTVIVVTMVVEEVGWERALFLLHVSTSGQQFQYARKYASVERVDAPFVVQKVGDTGAYLMEFSYSLHVLQQRVEW